MHLHLNRNSFTHLPVSYTHLELAVITKRLDFHLEQVQDFTPTPMTVATEAWYTAVSYTHLDVYKRQTLEGKLIDGSEFTVRALDFRRLEFGNKPTGTPNASVTFEDVYKRQSGTVAIIKRKECG